MPAQVAIATRFYRPYPGAGGAEVQAERLARFLVAEREACEIVTTRFRAGLPQAESEGGVEVRRLPTARGQLSRPVEFLLAFGWFLMNGGRFGVVHALCLSAFTLGAILGGRARGARTVVLPCTIGSRGDIAHVTDRPGGRLLWWGFRRADVMLAETSVVADELVAHGFPPERVIRIPALLGSIRERPLQAAERRAARADVGLPDRPVILYVGRLVEAKGIGLILDAWRAVSRRHRATLVLVGDGPMRARADALAASLGDPEAICVVGHRLDPGPYYRAADVFVFPSLGEAFGLALAEAMAAGLPVITTRTGLAGEWIRDGQDGLIVPAGDAVALAAAVDSLLSDEAQRRALGMQALARAQEAFAPARVGQAYLELHRKLLDGRAFATQG